jgi:hypothetical protein
MKITGELVADGSLWNDHINAQEMIDGGVTSFIIGLYQQNVNGKIVLHTNCRHICDQLATSKLTMQAYYYAYPEADPYKQADWFVNAMKEYPFKFAWADCEAYKYPMTGANRSISYQKFTARLHEGFPNCGVYTGKWYIDAFAPDLDKWLPQYPAWIPHYGYQPKLKTQMTWEQLKATWMPNYDIIISKGQTNPVGHQFTGDRCILPGTYDQYNRRMPLDVSLFTTSFMNSIRNNQPLIPPPPPPVIPKNYKVIIGVLNVRSSPDSSTPANLIGTISFGTQIYVDKIIGQWVHFVAQSGFPYGGYCWLGYLGRI